jgi:nucleotide-binding universal stress UspA family protein
MAPLLPFKDAGGADRITNQFLEATIMNPLSRVLAAVDFSKPAHRAFEYALALSKHHRAELVVLHAVRPDQPFDRRGRERLALIGRLRQRAEEAGVQFTDRVQHGDPAEIILLHARSVRPDVIVLGTHQRSGIHRMRAGSVGERVASKASVPVLLVPQRGYRAAAEPFRHVAVAIDFGASSDRAIEQAFALAGDSADRITLLHVVPGFSGGVPPHLYRYGIVEYQERLVQDARRHLQRFIPAERPASAKVETRVLVGETTTEIIHAVDRLGADLLVVGVPKRGTLARALFGTTAARLLKATPVPMLAVPEVAAAMVREKNTEPQLAA